MSLTHVCAWEPKAGYKRITLKEACERFPCGASARSGYFVCELCAQNVLLTAPGDYAQHFRHDPSSPNKECDERQLTFDPTYGRSLRGLNCLSVPLQLVVNNDSYELQVGFFFPPSNTAYCKSIQICAGGRTFKYPFEKVEKIGTTYFSVGETPCSKYTIEYIDANAELLVYWTNQITGVNPSGSFFDEKTGSMLLPGAKAYSKRNYYLLQREKIYQHPKDIEVTEVCIPKSPRYSSWHLYRICAKEFTEETAKFFLCRSIFLTEKPTKFYPIWPAYTKDPHFIYHNANTFYFYLCGDDAELKAYPGNPKVLDTKGGRLYKLYSREKEQLVSFGRSGALGFSYLIKKPIAQKNINAKIPISYPAEESLCGDNLIHLTKSRSITIKPEFDGKAIVKSKNKIQNIYKLTADTKTCITDLTLDTSIVFYYGNDCISTLRFSQIKADCFPSELDETLVRELRNCSGQMVAAPHSLGALAARCSHLPKTKQWLLRALRQGEIPKRAVALIAEQIKEHENG